MVGFDLTEAKRQAIDVRGESSQDLGLHIAHAFHQMFGLGLQGRIELRLGDWRAVVFHVLFDSTP